MWLQVTVTRPGSYQDFMPFFHPLVDLNSGPPDMLCAKCKWNHKQLLSIHVSMKCRNRISESQRLLYGKTLRFDTGKMLGSVPMRTACSFGESELEDTVQLAFLHGILPPAVNS